MNNKISAWFFWALGISIGVNILLFALLPLFGQRESKKNDLDIIVPVKLVKVSPQKPPPEEEKRLPEKKPPKVITTMRMQQKIPKRQLRQLKLEIPRLSFEINPKLSGGMPLAPPPPISAIYQKGEVDQMPLPIFKMKPVYPYRARRLNITGNVEVKFLVDQNGHAKHIKILKSNPPGIFDESVISALPSWRFSPAKLRGEAVSCWVITTIAFNLEGNN
jgi:protein TonB